MLAADYRSLRDIKQEVAVCSDSHGDGFGPGFKRFVGNAAADRDEMIAKLLERKARTESDRALTNGGLAEWFCDERAWVRQRACGSEIARMKRWGQPGWRGTRGPQATRAGKVWLHTAPGTVADWCWAM